MSTATTVDELAAGRAEPRRRRGDLSGRATLFHGANVADTVKLVLLAVAMAAA